ncbi:uncharacterized protein LOC122386119 [Amphibalanus amphitrite]|uniref:uncharacterized protein LOC122379379 n=1 Tax=Amphibalanus amphitrite TaxID=1232801 RepID=UPI001C908A10|nr:uncharacterized protein LOC122379379 [Amphibalanus amphitrite]XP_043230922.1 uncharacterized protein LOC122386119 [Amphibalanus amphitrite]
MSVYIQFKQISTLMALHSWKTVHPHRPLIKFRNGPHAATSERPAVHASPVTAAPAPAAASAPSGGGRRWTTVQSGPVLEEWQLPARYRRLPLEEREIECINNGGMP